MAQPETKLYETKLYETKLYEIKSWRTGSVLFSLECASMRLCVEAAVNAKYILQDADLRDAVLQGAVLQGADLQGAVLQGAVLQGADLQDAGLRGADLRGADDIITLGQPNGWTAYAYRAKTTTRVQIGCQNKTIAEGREYWACKHDRREVMAALDYAEKIAVLRGWTFEAED